MYTKYGIIRSYTIEANYHYCESLNANPIILHKAPNWKDTNKINSVSKAPKVKRVKAEHFMSLEDFQSVGKSILLTLHLLIPGSKSLKRSFFESIENLRLMMALELLNNSHESWEFEVMTDKAQIEKILKILNSNSKRSCSNKQRNTKQSCSIRSSSLTNKT